MWRAAVALLAGAAPAGASPYCDAVKDHLKPQGKLDKPFFRCGSIPTGSAQAPDSCAFQINGAQTQFSTMTCEKFCTDRDAVCVDGSLSVKGKSCTSWVSNGGCDIVNTNNPISENNWKLMCVCKDFTGVTPAPTSSPSSSTPSPTSTTPSPSSSTPSPTSSTPSPTSSTPSPTSTTPAPTSSTPSPTQESVSGDPFTSYGGKKTQFYLPAGEVKSLLACGAIELLGRARNSGIPGDDQQWFDMFQLQAGGRRALTVGVHNATRFLPSDAADARAEAVEETIDLKVVQEAALAAALARLRSAAAPGARTLTTLDVRTQEGTMSMTGAKFIASADINVTVAQDKSRQIGTGYAEVVDIQTKDLSMKFESSVAGKFATTMDRIRNAHVDISFTRLGDSACLTGMLPEIWGMKPMSSSTAKLLIPPSKVTNSDK